MTHGSCRGWCDATLHGDCRSTAWRTYKVVFSVFAALQCQAKKTNNKHKKNPYYCQTKHCYGALHGMNLAGAARYGTPLTSAAEGALAQGSNVDYVEDSSVSLTPPNRAGGGGGPHNSTPQYGTPLTAATEEVYSQALDQDANVDYVEDNTVLQAQNQAVAIGGALYAAEPLTTAPHYSTSPTPGEDANVYARINGIGIDTHSHA